MRRSKLERFNYNKTRTSCIESVIEISKKYRPNFVVPRFLRMNSYSSMTRNNLITN